MGARSGDSAPLARMHNWLKELDRKVGALPKGSDWPEELGPQRCRRFIMARFPELPRLLYEPVFSREIMRGHGLIQGSQHADRILRDLNALQRSQLAGLLLDIIEALEIYTARQPSKKARELAYEGERERRTRMLSRRVSSIRRTLEGLRDYAKDLHPLLGWEYVRAANRCLETLASLKEDSSIGQLYQSLNPTLEDPRQLGIVELYWFFHHECGCSGRDSEVRVAMVANEFLANNLAYVPEYKDGESQGCPAVRQAVRRYRPHTLS